MAISSTYTDKQEMDLYAEVFEIDDGVEISRYTGYHEPIVFGGFTYKPAPIHRGDIERGTSFEEVTCTIYGPVVEEFTKYISNYPIVPSKVTVTRGIVGLFDSQNIIVFKGVVKSVQLEDNVAVASCASLGSILGAVWPPDLHSSFCQNTLFDTGCGVDANAHSQTITVQSFTAKGGIVSSEIVNAPHYTGGYVLFMGDFRWITLGIDTHLDLHVPFDSHLQIGNVVRIFKGCDKTATMCRDRFSNLSRFFGCPYIPSDNPVMWGF